MVAAESVSDFTPQRQARVAQKIADAAGVATAAVGLAVESASVRITASIQVGSVGESQSVVWSLTSAFANAAQTSAALELTVTTAPTVQTTSSLIPAPASTPTPAVPSLPLLPPVNQEGSDSLALESGSSSDSTVIIIIAIAGGFVGVALAVLLLRHRYRDRPNAKEIIQAVPTVPVHKHRFPSGGQPQVIRSV